LRLIQARKLAFKLGLKPTQNINDAVKFMTGLYKGVFVETDSTLMEIKSVLFTTKG